MSDHQRSSPREPRPGEWMAPQDFENVIRLTPLVAIDLIIRALDGKVLVGRRTNEPARGVFFVPGGRITKNESRTAAFRRISQEELGIGLDIAGARFHSVNDHIYETNRFCKPGFGTHYVTLAYELSLALEISSLPKDQHGEFEWMSPGELLRSHEVHDNTKAYFR